VGSRRSRNFRNRNYSEAAIWGSIAINGPTAPRQSQNPCERCQPLDHPHPISARLVVTGIDDDFKSDALISFQRAGFHEIARMNGYVRPAVIWHDKTEAPIVVKMRNYFCVVSQREVSVPLGFSGRVPEAQNRFLNCPLPKVVASTNRLLHRRNRDGSSTRKLAIGVFTQPGSKPEKLNESKCFPLFTQ
jgi:hypothetical protein